MSGTLAIPEAAAQRPDSTLEHLEGELLVLHRHRQAWIDTSLETRIELIEDVRRRTLDVADAWVAAACQAKGIERGTAAEGEEWQGGPWLTLRNLRLLQRSLEDLLAGDPPRVGGTIEPREGGAAVPVFPLDVWDRALFTGFSAEAWVDHAPEHVADRQAEAHRPGADVAPSLCTVLGAGNVSSIAPTDALYKLFVELKVVMLKVNPVNAYVGPILEEAFAPLIDRGVLRLAYGGVDVGKLLTSHELVDAIHMTGSDKTHDAIVFGTGEEGRSRRESGEIANHREMTSELGNVTPVIVVPGPWKDRDFAYQREHLALMLTNNAGFNCVATRVLVQHEGWPHRERLLSELALAFDEIVTRTAYYPGAADRFSAFVEAHPEAQRIGLHSDERLPWTLIKDVDEADADDICFTTEAFASVTAEVALPADDPVEFVEAAVDFCNNRLWGTLGATLLVHPRSPRKVKAAVRRAASRLRYGTVAINQWSAVGFALMSTPWGAYPGATPTDIQSGTGVVHNTPMLTGVRKTVVKGPWRVVPKQPAFPSHRRADRAGRALATFEADPSLRRLLPLVYHSLRG